MTEETKIAHRNVYSALCAAQSEMGTVVKGAVNPAFKSKYANLADVMSVVVPALTAHGIAVYHTMIRDDLGTAMRTVLHHGESETHIDCDVPLIVAKNDMQGMKSATTYAKRIGVESLTGIAPEDDDGNAAAKAAPVMDEMAGFNADVSQALKDIGREKTLDGLVAYFTDLYRNKRAVAEDGRVVRAKDDRKKALSAAGKDDLAGDNIPY